MRDLAAPGDGVAQWCGGMAGGEAARVSGLLLAMGYRTPLRTLGDSVLLGKNNAKIGLRASVTARRSRTAPKIGRRARLIREKIIGHGMRGFAARVVRSNALSVARRDDRGRGLLAIWGMLALFDQPAGQHGRGVFFEPGIEQLRDLLAEIVGVAEPRELITLQGIAGRRKQKLPRRLGFVIQGGLQGKPSDVISVVNTVNSTHLRTYCGNLCKSAVWYFTETFRPTEPGKP